MLDASALAALLLNAPAGQAARLRRCIGQPGETVHVPHLLDLEVVQVLRRLLQGGALDPAAAASIVEDLRQFPAVRYPHQPFLPRIWALRANLTAYDAAYVALAEALDAPLVTLDARIQRAPGHSATVEVF